MHKTTERGRSTGLLELERASDSSRSHRSAETANISEPFLDERVYAEAAQPVAAERRRGRRGTKFSSRFSSKNRWARITAVLVIVVALGLASAIVWEIKSVMLHNPRFLLHSTADIQMSGNRVTPAGELLAFFAPDIGRSILRVPLAKRQTELKGIPWVRQATVMRLWPDRLAVHLVERTPIAFARDGNIIRLVDEDGVLLDLPTSVAIRHYSFPVLMGLSSAEPLSTRATRIARYRQFTQSLDAEGDHVSATLSEVNLSDPQDVRAVFSGGAHPPVVHFGFGNFLPRYRAYRAHLAEWLRQYPELRSVDMRYGRHVVLDTGVQPQAAAQATAHVIAANTGKAAAAHADRVTLKKTRAVERRTHTRASSRNVKASHRRLVHRHARQRAPERGHKVRHPIMHVVNGM